MNPNCRDEYPADAVPFGGYARRRRRVRYVKGVPEIVRSLCAKAVGDESVETLNERLLASLPPAERVMHDKPCDRNAFIIDGDMKRMILVTGGIFFLLLLGFVYVCEHADVTSLTDLCNLQFGTGMGLSALEKSYIFTFFVMLQFWNMFNARAYLTGQSAFHFKQCKSFLFILLVILVGQILIVTLGAQMFNLTPLPLRDWAILIGSTSVVLWIGEAIRLFRK